MATPSTLELFEQADRLAPDLVAEWTERARAMPIEPVGTTPLLHEPVYDCANDLFEPPCAASDFDDSDGACWIAPDGLAQQFHWWAHAEARERVRVVFGHAHAVIDGGRFIDVLQHPDSLKEPGALVTRLVRVESERWHVHRWKCGMSRSPGALDPTFFVQALAKKPQAWLDRERKLRELWRANGNWQSGARSCRHRA